MSQRGGAPLEAISIPGLQLLEELGRGAHSVVLRARREGEDYAVKLRRPLPPGLLHAEEAAGEAVRSFRREAAALARVQHPHVAQVMEAGEVDGRLYLVMEYVRGRTLAAALAEGPLSPRAAVRLGVQLSGALAAVHRQGLVHRDLTPQNVLLTPEGDAKLIDFGFATRLRPSSPAAEAAEAAGTGLYTAPEQSGLLKRPLDGRADLYALGALLFECLTGRPPFLAPDAGELLRQHAVVPPPEVRALQPGVGPALAAVVARLLAKDPDDRYQSAGGLAADLARLPELEAEAATGAPPALGVHDALPEAGGETALVGREGELAQLEALRQAACGGRGAAVLLEGEAGSGKSRLARELERRAGPGVLRLCGKCSPADGTPFAPLRQALEDHLAALRRAPPRVRAEAERRLHEAAGELLPLLVPLLPSLLPGFPPPPPAGGEEVPQRHGPALADFLARLARAHGAALLRVDDVQWLDAASRDVLARLAERLPRTPLLLTCTARSGPAGREGVQRAAEALGGALALRLPLRPLDEEGVHRLVSACLGGQPVAPQVVRRVQVRSGGNPLAVEELVRAMLEAGLLRRAWGQWLAADALEGLPLPEDVAALVAQRAAGLGPATRGVLVAAAVVGGRFRAELLPAVAGVDEDAVLDAVDEAARARLVEPRADGAWAFVHDTLREALLARLSPDETRRLHRRVAEALEARGGEGPEHIYALAHHHAQGEPESDPRRVWEAQRAAGSQAAALGADAEAYGFLTRAEAARGRAGLPPDVLLEKLLADVCVQSGRLEEGGAWGQRVLAHASAPSLRARMRLRLAQVQLAELEPGAAREELARAFAEVGHRPPGRSPWALARTLWDWPRAASAAARAAPPPGAGGAREALETLALLHEQALWVAHLAGDRAALVQGQVQLLRLGARLGPSPELARAHGSHATVLALLGRRTAAARHARRALALAERLGSRRLLAACLTYAGLADLHAGNAPRASLRLRRALEEHGRWMEPTTAVLAARTLHWTCLLRGEAHPALEWAQHSVALADDQGRRAGQSLFPLLGLYASAAGALAVGRRSEALLALQRATLLQPETPRVPALAAEVLAATLFCHLAQGELGAPLEETAARFTALGLAPARLPLPPRAGYVFLAYARLSQAARARGGALPTALARLSEALRLLRRAARQPLLRCHLHVVEAGAARLAGHPRRALALLARAEALAAEVDSPWALFEAARERALARRALGQPGAVHDARAAVVLAAQHGWQPRARQLAAELGVADALEALAGLSPRPLASPGPGQRTLQLQRALDGLLQVSLAAAQAREVAEQARAVLDEVVRLLAAERAFLLLVAEDGALRLAAGRTAQGTDVTAPSGYSTTVVEQVRATRRPLVVSGTEEGAALGSQSAVLHDLRSIVAVPVCMRERLLGVVYLDNRLARGLFTGEDVALLTALGNHIAIALEMRRTAQLEQQVEAERQQRRFAETLRELTAAVTSSLALGQALELLLEGLWQVVPFARGAVLLWREGRLEVAAAHGEGAAAHAQAAWAPLLAPGGPLEPCLVERRLVRGEEGPLPGGRRALMAVPLVSGGAVVGALVLAGRGAEPFGPHEAELATSFAGQAGVALYNARLFGEVQRLAVTDELTGLANRRHLFTLGPAELQRARRYGRPLSVVLFDVDHFKRLNDTYGHAVGDEVLRQVAERCRAALRETDVLARYGGEEFVALLPETDVGTAREVLAERLRRAVADTPIPSSAGPLPVTVSLGVAALGPSGADWDALLKRADAALYAAKGAGRNRVVA